MMTKTKTKYTDNFELVYLLFSASVKNSHYDGIKVQQNTFQSTKSNVDLVDKNNTVLQVGRHLQWSEQCESEQCGVSEMWK